jgi:hypothetical protein
LDDGWIRVGCVHAIRGESARERERECERVRFVYREYPSYYDDLRTFVDMFDLFLLWQFLPNENFASWKEHVGVVKCDTTIQHSSYNARKNSDDVTSVTHTVNTMGPPKK